MSEQELRPYLEELLKLNREWDLPHWMDEFTVDYHLMFDILNAIKTYLEETK